MDYICPVVSFGAKNIGSAWLSIKPLQLARTARNDLLTTLSQRYERCFLVQHLSKPPLALTVTAAFLAASVAVSVGPRASSILVCHMPDSEKHMLLVEFPDLEIGSAAERHATEQVDGDAALIILQRYCT
jgi:hypothetical protein